MSVSFWGHYNFYFLHPCIRRVEAWVLLLTWYCPRIRPWHPRHYQSCAPVRGGLNTVNNSGTRICQECHKFDKSTPKKICPEKSANIMPLVVNWSTCSSLASLPPCPFCIFCSSSHGTLIRTRSFLYSNFRRQKQFGYKFSAAFGTLKTTSWMHISLTVLAIQCYKWVKVDIFLDKILVTFFFFKLK